MEENSEPSGSGNQKLKESVKIENGQKDFVDPQCSIKSEDGPRCLQSPLADEKDKASESPSPSSAPGKKSPEPTCAICLELLQNKAFTDSCFHSFCFKCLKEWSKVKPECPLCKQSFTSIVHNVRSIEDYDQYRVMSNNTDCSLQADGRRFRYSTTLTSDRLNERGQRSMWIGDFVRQSDLQTHRSYYAPHSVNFQLPATIGNIETLPAFPPILTPSSPPPPSPPLNSQRLRIYENNLWAKKSVGRTRVRSASPSFYRLNPACTHRLIPWLNRELLALLHNSETRVMFVLDLILALITSYDIRSQEFYLHMQPYLGCRTSHFVHEFFNFASSPHDMSVYDENVVYEVQDTHNDPIILSSPDSDALHNSSSTNINRSSTAPSTSSNSRKKGRKKRVKKTVTKLYLKRNLENNLWNVATSSLALTEPNGLFDILDITGNLEPSTSRHNSVIVSPSVPDVATINDDSSGSECLIVDCVGPRTPELIDLVSDGEEKRKASTRKSNEVEQSNGLSMLLRTSRFADGEPVPSTSGSMQQSSVEFNNGLVSSSSSSETTTNKKKKKTTENFETMNGNAYDTSSSVEADNCDRWSLSSQSSEPSLAISSSNSYFKGPETSSLYYKNNFLSDSTDISDSNCEKQTDKPRTPVKKLRSVIGSVKSGFYFNEPDYHSSHSKKHKMKHKKKQKHRHKSSSREER